MKQFLTLILFLIAIIKCYGNMASPFSEGTLGCSVFSSKDIDILNEKIHIKINKSFSTANYVVEYTIQSDSSGNQIPLLFYARYYESDFRVWLDDSPIELLDIPNSYKDSTNINLDGFSNSFEKPNRDNGLETVSIASQWDYTVHTVSDLKYFKINLSKGKHIVRVEYKAHPGGESFDWIINYSFQYSLSPTKFWKSFHSLDIIIDATELKGKKLTTSLGQPIKGRLDSIAYFHFETLPADYFSISYKPEPNILASILIGLGPLGLSIILLIILSYLHYKVLKSYKISEPESSSWIVGVGSFLIPLVVLIFSILSFELIDEVIGKDASRHHGYTFLLIVFYPVLLIVYWAIMGTINKDMNRNIRSHSNNKFS